ncbi:uncharacterized protein LOC131928230 [Physella acuta]|uniref:uncharacterized protein LOC131928230 n=1 Tax=Physella acuta TaxID=109671 RepID=UPI0027DBED30|nr:uncharacterized protein LOC131928230 [Physella acuta]
MLRRSYWSVFGNFFLEEMESTESKDDNACTDDSALYSNYTHLRCPSNVGRYYVPVLMGMYVMITNILLFNLIIAKFNSTIYDIEKDVEKVWHYQLFSLTAEYSKRLVMQPPFFPLTFIMYTCMRRENTNLFVIEFKPAVANCLKRLEQVVMDDYLRPTQKENNQRCNEPENNSNEIVTKFSLSNLIHRAVETNSKVQSGDEDRSGEDQGNNANENSGESKSMKGLFADLINTESEQNQKVSDDGVRNAIRRLKRNLKAVGRKMIHLQPDGNCIFRAAVASLKDKITPEELRHQVYLHIRKYESHYGEFLTDKSIVEKIKEDGHWNSEAGDLIPYAISNVLGRSLTIVTNNVGNICIPVSNGDCLNDKPIFLAYLSYPGSEHYCATKR